MKSIPLRLALGSLFLAVASALAENPSLTIAALVAAFVFFAIDEIRLWIGKGLS